MTRKGKIARLPRETRDALNRYLQDNQPGPALLDWLNALPEVQAVLAREFDGHPVTKQNLSEWRTGGFAEWQARQEALADAREFAADAEELTQATEGRLADHLATMLTARYATALVGWNGDLTDEFRRKLRGLRTLCQDIVELRRGDHSAARLKIEQEHLECERDKTAEELYVHFERWATNPDLRNALSDERLSLAERRRRMREVFDLPTRSPRTTRPQPVRPRPGPTKSNQVQPSPTRSSRPMTQPLVSRPNRDAASGPPAGASPARKLALRLALIRPPKAGSAAAGPALRGAGEGGAGTPLRGKGLSAAGAKAASHK